MFWFLDSTTQSIVYSILWHRKQIESQKQKKEIMIMYIFISLKNKGVGPPPQGSSFDAYAIVLIIAGKSYF